MISYETIVAEIQKHASAAVGSDAKIREELAVIRALCDVALGSTADVPVQPLPQAVQQPIMKAPPVVMQQAAPTLPTKKINEEDANGDSLFDF